MKKSVVFLLVVSLTMAMVAGVAEAKGKPSGKGKPAQKKVPVVTYVFEGEVASVPGNSVTVDVSGGNRFASAYVGQQVEFAVSGATRVIKDDAKASVSDVAAGDTVVVQVRAPKSGATSFVARMIVAESPAAMEEPAPDEGTEPAI